MIKGSFNDRTDIVAALPDNGIQISFVHGPENDAEGYEQDNGKYGDGKDYLPIDGRLVSKLTFKEFFHLIQGILSPIKIVIYSATKNKIPVLCSTGIRTFIYREASKN